MGMAIPIIFPTTLPFEKSFCADAIVNLDSVVHPTYFPIIAQISV